jgi:hypothetical protein
MRRVDHVTCREDMRNPHNIFVGKPGRTLGIHQKVILKYILNEIGYENFGYMKGGEFLDFLKD